MNYCPKNLGVLHSKMCRVILIKSLRISWDSHVVLSKTTKIFIINTTSSSNSCTLNFNVIGGLPL